MNCSSGHANSAQAKFCATCGEPLRAAPATCANCHAPLSPGAKFCPACGTPVTDASARRVPPAPVPAAAPVTAARRPPTPASTPTRPPAARVAAPVPGPNFLVGIVVVFVVCAIVSRVGWVPLAQVPLAVAGYLPGPSYCSAKAEGSFDMYICSALVAFSRLLPVALTMLVIAALRTTLTRLLQAAASRLPAASRYLVAPVAATIFFAMAWAGMHYVPKEPEKVGLLPQSLFPALVGVFPFLVAQYGLALQRSLAFLFLLRDRVPRGLRFVAILALPLAVAYVLTNQQKVTDEIFKEQIVVLLSMVAGYVLLSKREVMTTPDKGSEHHLHDLARRDA